MDEAMTVDLGVDVWKIHTKDKSSLLKFLYEEEKALAKSIGRWNAFADECARKRIANLSKNWAKKEREIRYYAKRRELCGLLFQCSLLHRFKYQKPLFAGRCKYHPGTPRWKCGGEMWHCIACNKCFCEAHRHHHHGNAYEAKRGETEFCETNSFELAGNLYRNEDGKYMCRSCGKWFDDEDNDCDSCRVHSGDFNPDDDVYACCKDARYREDFCSAAYHLPGKFSVRFDYDGMAPIRAITDCREVRWYYEGTSLHDPAYKEWNELMRERNDALKRFVVGADGKTAFERGEAALPAWDFANEAEMFRNKFARF